MRSRVLALAASLFVVAVVSLAGQARQTFDVASVKPCRDEPNTGGQRRQEFTAVPGRVTIECLTLGRLIYLAHAGIGNLKDPLVNDQPVGSERVRGGPGWIQVDKFTIIATAEGTSDREVLMGPMLRALLEDRFKLQIHRELEDVPMYALTVAKGGLKIQPIPIDGCTSFEAVKDLPVQELLAVDRGPRPVCGNFTALANEGNRLWILGGETMARFASSQLSSVLDRHVLDQTGVTGLFNITLEFAMDESIRAGVFGGRPAGAPPRETSSGVSIFTALEEQLGLKIEKTRGPHGFIMVDRVERPSEN